MKKLSISLAVVAMAAFTLSSCKKDYTCECSYSDNLGNKFTASTVINDTKKNAEDACTANQTTIGSYTWKCEIK